MLSNLFKQTKSVLHLLRFLGWNTFDGCVETLSLGKLLAGFAAFDHLHSDLKHDEMICLVLNLKGYLLAVIKGCLSEFDI